MCYLCETTLLTKDLLETHINSVHTSYILNLAEIALLETSESFPNKQVMAYCNSSDSNHARNVMTDANPELIFPSTDEITMDEPYYECIQCPFKSSLTNDLKPHVETYHDILDFPCPICGTIFNDISKLKLHVDTTHCPDKHDLVD